jgi:hypothetical protein
MPRIVLTATVDDATVWEERYRSHGEVFKQVWPGPMPVIHFTTTEDNEVAMCTDVDDVDAYFKMLGSPEIAEAMAHDGVQRNTVKVYVLDKTASF